MLGDSAQIQGLLLRKSVYGVYHRSATGLRFHAAAAPMPKGLEDILDRMVPELNQELTCTAGRVEDTVSDGRR